MLTEAQSIGLPYVAVDVGGVREMTPPEGLRAIVPHGAVAEFAHVATKLLEQKDVHRAFAEAELRWVDRYDKKVILGRFLEILHRS